jgi:hypothetical protein
MLYGTEECWTVKSQHKNNIIIAEMRMLRLMCGKTGRDRIKNENIRERERERVRVALVEMMVETRLM